MWAHTVRGRLLPTPHAAGQLSPHQPVVYRARSSYYTSHSESRWALWLLYGNVFQQSRDDRKGKDKISIGDNYRQSALDKQGVRGDTLWENSAICESLLLSHSSFSRPGDIRSNIWSSCDSKKLTQCCWFNPTGASCFGKGISGFSFRRSPSNQSFSWYSFSWYYVMNMHALWKPQSHPWMHIAACLLTILGQ